MCFGGIAIVASFACTLFSTGTRAAECTQPAVPRVDWQCRFFDDRNLSGRDPPRTRLTGARFACATMIGVALARATWIDGKRICAGGSLGDRNRVRR